MSRSAGKKNGNIRKILLIGLTILSLCLFICLSVLWMLYSTYRSETQVSVHEHHMNAGQMLDSAIAYFVNMNVSAANSLGDVNYKSDEDRIYEVLDLYDSYQLVSMTGYYVGGNLYSDHTITNKNELSEALRGLISTIESNKFEQFTTYGDFVPGEDESAIHNELALIQPVYKGDVEAGYSIILLYMDGLFDTNAYSYELSNGECYVIGKEAELIAKSPAACILRPEDDDFGTGILSYSDGKAESKREVQEIRNAVSKGENGFVEIKTRRGQSIQISYYSLTNAKGLAFVTCFNENLIDNSIQPLIFRVALACMIIMCIMILVVIYVWAGNKRANLMIEKLAYEDPVTKGKNINFFKDFAVEQMAIYKETPFLIHRFDICNFRYINESYGHKRADEILASCIDNFREVFDDNELCVRITADQFLAITVNDKTYAGKIKAYRDKVNADARSRGIKFPIKFKSGIYQVRKHDRDIDVMIDHANVARKSLGDDENKHETEAFYSENIVNDMRKVDRIESDMQRALATGEFKVYYQPKWDIVNDHVAGAEALIRWIKPDGSMVYPDVFIPIFEKNGFVEKLDFYTLETVCQQMKELLDAGRTVYPVSVNQSRLLFHSPDYVENVAKIIKKYNIPEGAIELEITETVFLDEKDMMIDAMKELRKVGVRLSMDDFGSGYSSLNMLKEAPFDIVKIDREFFSESITSDRSMWILQKIIDMVRGLGMEVICEGVETGEQSMILKSIGCCMVQGYFYSRPIPSDEYFKRYC